MTAWIYVDTSKQATIDSETMIVAIPMIWM